MLILTFLKVGLIYYAGMYVMMFMIFLVAKQINFPKSVVQNDIGFK